MADHSKVPTEDELEQLTDEEEPVYSVEWDSGAPGAGAGVEQIYRWQGGYVVVSDQGESDAVHPTLRDAIAEAELNHVTSATREIRSTELTSEEIAAMLRTVDRGSYRVRINGEEWATEGAGWLRQT